MKEKVSIAITSFNGEKYIKHQLESLILQSRMADECVISDDCSTDSTVCIVKEFIRCHKLSNWTLLRNEKNVGFIKNYRKAMSYTTGDIVFLCDQDDVWIRDKIEAMTSIIVNDQRIVALISSFDIIDNEEKIVIQKHGLLKSNNGLIKKKYKKDEITKIDSYMILHSNVSPGCTAAFRREVIDKYFLIDIDHIAPHDWALGVLAANMGGLYFWNRPTIMYRLHEANTVGLWPRSENIKGRCSALISYKNIQSEYSCYPISEKLRFQALRNAAFTNFRIFTLSKRNVIVWIGGLFRFFRQSIYSYFPSYVMDFKFILKRK